MVGEKDLLKEKRRDAGIMQKGQSSGSAEVQDCSRESKKSDPDLNNDAKTEKTSIGKRERNGGRDKEVRREGGEARVPSSQPSARYAKEIEGPDGRTPDNVGTLHSRRPRRKRGSKLNKGRGKRKRVSLESPCDWIAENARARAGRRTPLFVQKLNNALTKTGEGKKHIVKMNQR